MNRRSFLQTLTAATFAAPGLKAAAPAPPNIILILADDLGYGDIGSFGSRIPTPFLDQMAKEGIRGRNFYAPAAVCSPSRAGILTGRYAARMGCAGVLMPNDEGGLPADETTIARMLKSTGYRTACIGKWHLGSAPGFLPNDHGFDTYFGIPYSHDMLPLPLYRNRTVIDRRPALELLTAQFTSEAVNFINASKDKPFFLYLAHTAPHIPLITGRAFRGFSGFGHYGDMVAELDDSCGKIMDAVRKAGLDENTLIVFTSDNGPWYEGTAGRFRGRKGETWDGGLRVPFIARFPKRIAPNSVMDDDTYGLDLLPTFASVAGASLPAKPSDGVDIWPLLNGSGKTVERDAFLFFDGIQLQAARLGNFKLHVARYNSPPWVEAPASGRWNLPLPRPELYNVVTDPGESLNIVAERPRIAAQIRDAIDRVMLTFPADVQAAWRDTLQRVVIETPPGAVPVLSQQQP